MFSERVDLYRFLTSAAKHGGPVRLLPVMISRSTLERPLTTGYLSTRYDVRLS